MTYPNRHIISCLIIVTLFLSNLLFTVNYGLAKIIYGLDLCITWDGGDWDHGSGIALDDSGNIYITGFTINHLEGLGDAFIAKYDSTGNSVLNITWGGSGLDHDSGSEIVLDDSGNIYITGETDSFGTGYFDAFIAKFDSTGNSLLNITWDGGNEDSGSAITLDNSGNIYITGYTASSGLGNVDAFILKYLSESDDTPGIPSYNLFLLLGILSAVAILISKKLKKS